MHNNMLVALAIGVLAFSACHSDKNPSKSDFAQVLQKGLNGQCNYLTHDFGQFDNFPSKFEIKVGEEKSPVQVQLDALVHAGLLHSEDVRATTTGDWKPGIVKPWQVITTTYTLTAIGKQQYTKKDVKNIFGASIKTGAFCVTNYRIDEVTNFTVPGQNPLLSGGMSSDVYFTYSPDQISPWANDPAVQAAFPEIKKKLANGQNGSATLVLTNDGWRNSADLK